MFANISRGMSATAYFDFQALTMCASSLTRQLPFNTPFSAKVALIEKIFESWEDHCSVCFITVYEATIDELHDLSQKHFGNLIQTPLLDHVNTIIEDQVEKAKSKTVEQMRWMLDLEYPPFTNNDHYFSSYRDKYLAKYKDARKVSMIIGLDCFVY